MPKKRYIKDIYNTAKKNWKKNRKQKVIYFYLKEELEKELKENPDRYLEIKAYCDELSDVTDISILIAVLSTLIEISEIKIYIVTLAIVAIYAVIPYKKCKFVLDNIKEQELEKIMDKQDNLNKQENIDDLIEKVNVLKQKWLNKEVSLFELGDDIRLLVENMKMKPDYWKIKMYIENKLVLDKNISESENLITNVSLTFISILIATNSLFLNQIEGTWTYMYMIVALLALIGIIILCCLVIKKHIGKYAREKSFYEIVRNAMEE